MKRNEILINILKRSGWDYHHLDLNNINDGDLISQSERAIIDGENKIVTTQITIRQLKTIMDYTHHELKLVLNKSL